MMTTTVDSIAENRVMKRGTVNPNLMGATGFEV